MRTNLWLHASRVRLPTRCLLALPVGFEAGPRLFSLRIDELLDVTLRQLDRQPTIDAVMHLSILSRDNQLELAAHTFLQPTLPHR